MLSKTQLLKSVRHVLSLSSHSRGSGLHLDNGDHSKNCVSISYQKQTSSFLGMVYLCLYFCFYACVYGWRYTHIYVWVHGDQRSSWVEIPHQSDLFFLLDRISQSLELGNLAKVAIYQVSGILLSLPPLPVPVAQLPACTIIFGFLHELWGPRLRSLCLHNKLFLNWAIY